jgi:hypothetical protein
VLNVPVVLEASASIPLAVERRYLASVKTASPQQEQPDST